MVNITELSVCARARARTHAHTHTHTQRERERERCFNLVFLYCCDIYIMYSSLFCINKGSFYMT